MVRAVLIFAFTYFMLDFGSLAIRQEADLKDEFIKTEASSQHRTSETGSVKGLANAFALLHEKIAEMEAGFILVLKDTRRELQETRLELKETRREVKRMQETHPTRKDSLLFDDQSLKSRAGVQAEISSKIPVSAMAMLSSDISSTRNFQKLKGTLFMRSIRKLIKLNSEGNKLEDHTSDVDHIDVEHDFVNATSLSGMTTAGLGANCGFPSVSGVGVDGDGLTLNFGHFNCSLNWDFGWGMSGDVSLFDMNMNFGTIQWGDFMKTIFSWGSYFANPIELLTHILELGLQKIGAGVAYMLESIAEKGVSKALQAATAVCAVVDSHLPNAHPESGLLTRQSGARSSALERGQEVTASADADDGYYCFTLDAKFNLPSVLPLIVVTIPLDFLPPTVRFNIDLCLSKSFGLGSDDLAKVTFEVVGYGVPFIQVTVPIGGAAGFLDDGCVPFDTTGGALIGRKSASTSEGKLSLEERRAMIRNATTVTVQSFDFVFGTQVKINRNASGDEARSWLGALMGSKGRGSSVAEKQNMKHSLNDSVLFNFDTGEGAFEMKFEGTVVDGQISVIINFLAGLSKDHHIVDFNTTVDVFNARKIIDDFFNGITCMTTCAKARFKLCLLNLLDGGNCV